MALKPDLTPTANVQNVVVYVSNDNFAQSYAVESQNVPQQTGGYPNHSMAPMVPTKNYPQQDKPIYNSNGQIVNTTSNQGGYFENLSYPVRNIGYQNGAKPDLISCERQTGPGRPEISGGIKQIECDNRGYNNESYVTILGPEVPTQSVRCDSVRSETAESSCSSLSSAEDGMIVVQNPSPEMVVYDPSVSVRPEGVVLVSPPSMSEHAPISGATVGLNQQQDVVVPYGWKRLLNNGSIIYISPSNSPLSSLEQVKEYLLTSGTCKCGLECHFKYDNVFNFDPKVMGKPWVLSPDTNTGDLTKLCNHKRKIMAMASLDCKPPDLEGKMRKDYGLKKKKRKIGVSLAGGVPVSQILAQHEKLAMEQQVFNRGVVTSGQPIWPADNPTSHNHLQSFVGNEMVPSHDQTNNRMMTISPVVLGDNHPSSPANQHGGNIRIHTQQVIGPNGQIINVQEIPQVHRGMAHQGQNQIVQGQNVMQHPQQQQQQQPPQQQHNRVYMNTQPLEPSGPGRPLNHQLKLTSTEMQKKVSQQQQQQHVFNNQPLQHFDHIDPNKNIRPFGFNGVRQIGPHPNSLMHIQHQQQMQQKFQWQQRMQNFNQLQMQQQQANANMYERVPPLHQHNGVWQEEIRRKRVKFGKSVKNRPYQMADASPMSGGPPNIDVRQIPGENIRSVVINQLPQHNQNLASSPSFMEDPSGYLAQQTALLNNTINRQTGVNSNSNYVCSSSGPLSQQSNIIATSSSQSGEIPLPSNVNMNIKPQIPRMNVMKQQMHHQKVQFNNQVHQHVADSSVVHDQQMHQFIQQCQGCIPEATHQYSQNIQKTKATSRSDSGPNTPSSCGTSEDPVTSSMYSEKHHSQPSPDTRPIQGGTVSTSNVSPMDSIHSDPPTPNPHAQPPTPPHKSSEVFNVHNQEGQIVQIVSQSRENYIQQYQQEHLEQQQYKLHSHSSQNRPERTGYITSVVTTMASSRTSGCNTITSVLAGRANTATVSVNNQTGSNSPPLGNNQLHSINVSKSPLEMVQSVVSSIQVPHSQQNITVSIASPQVSPQIVKHSPTGLPPGHILVSSNGQLIMATTNTGQPNVMAPPPPPKVITSQNAMPPVSVSPVVTNVTASVSQVIPAVAQQVLGQQTVLVNTLPTPFVIQPGVTMTMDGMTVGQNMQIPQLVTGNVIQQQIQMDNNDHRRVPALLSPEPKKKGKKRKLPSQTVAGMLHIAAQQNSGMVVNQSGFPQQIQMTHSPQGITTTPVMQALTIVPSKNGGPPQIVMNGQSGLGTQQIITNSQPTQQINLLQPVSLINGTTGVVQNIPIQQFIVPNIGGSMIMNADGTTTILQDTSNLGMQLQIQNVNGQNVLTSIQNNNMFNGGQSILAAGPAGMVIRAPTSQGKIIQQQHSPGAQFLSPNGSQFVVNGAQFSGQLSPLVASVSPSQQVTFNTSPQQIRSSNQLPQELIQVNGQMGQTLMVPCTPQATNSSNQNTTFVQQNTTIVQQQTTMVANNQHVQNNQQQNIARAAINLDHQNFMISDKGQMPTLLVQQHHRNSSQDDLHYRQSVSTQTAVNQNSQAVTTNTFCQTSTSSPPDTTTLSPINSGGQSPPTADTTTHTGSTDDGLSPAPSNCSEINIPGRPGSRTMAMVHCVSSSEPDLLESNTIHSDHEWRKLSQSTSSIKEEYIMKQEFTDVTSGMMHYSKKQQNMGHITFEDSANFVPGIQYMDQKMKQDVMNAKHYGKLMHQKRNNDVMLVMDSRHLSLFDDEDDETKRSRISKHDFKPRDLVWGPTKGSSAWPAKIIEINGDLATVKWFGSDRNLSKIKINALQTLTEGFESHHQARNKARTSRKLNTQLEKAIQEAMVELDKTTDGSVTETKEKVSSSSGKKSRLRSGQQR